MIKSKDSYALIDLSLQCQSAQLLYRTKPNAIPALEEPGTLDAIVRRLDDTLQTDWFTYTRYSKNHQIPTFKDFMDWIEGQADIARLRKDACRDRDSDQNPTTKTYAEVTTSTMAKPTASAGHQQVNSPKPKRSTPQGDKEYRDTIRRRPSFSKTPMSPRGQSNNSSDSPRLQVRSRNTSPIANAPWCAWCTENGAPHRHSTPDCSMLKIANVQDQCRVLKKHKVCDSCLFPTT